MERQGCCCDSLTLAHRPWRKQKLLPCKGRYSPARFKILLFHVCSRDPCRWKPGSTTLHFYAGILVSEDSPAWHSSICRAVTHWICIAYFVSRSNNYRSTLWPSGFVLIVTIEQCSSHIAKLIHCQTGCKLRKFFDVIHREQSVF